jgi:hypothetical protein
MLVAQLGQLRRWIQLREWLAHIIRRGGMTFNVAKEASEKFI